MIRFTRADWAAFAAAALTVVTFIANQAGIRPDPAPSQELVTLAGVVTAGLGALAHYLSRKGGA